MVNQRHARAGSSDLIFETERPRRRVGIHHENEVEEASFADGRFCGGSGSRPWPCVTEFGWVRVTVRRSAACKQCDGQTSAHYTRLVNKRQAIKLLAWNNSPANL